MLSLTIGPNAQNLLAATNDELYSFTTKDGEPALYDHANKAYVVKAWTADGKEISLSEYKSIIEGSNKLNTQNAITLTSNDNQKTNQQVEKINALNYINMNYYEKDLTWAATASPQKVSPSVDALLGNLHHARYKLRILFNLLNHFRQVLMQETKIILE